LELASSDVLQQDAARAPLLKLAFVRTWVLLALAVAAVIVAWRRWDLALGPGAIVASHALACTLVYPLSHYRSPAIPAMAVMAGVGFADLAGALTPVGRRRLGVAALAAAALVAILGAVPPQAPTFAEAAVAESAAAAYAAGDDETAEALARQSLAVSPDDLLALTVQLQVATRQGRLEDARRAASRLVELRPWDPSALTDVAWTDARLGRTALALQEVDAVVALYPWSGKVRSGRGVVRLFTGDVAGGREDLRFAMDRGVRPPAWALEKAGL
jgi:tetratricopeptide (TPR) repeat protein